MSAQEDSIVLMETVENADHIQYIIKEQETAIASKDMSWTTLIAFRKLMHLLNLHHLLLLQLFVVIIKISLMDNAFAKQDII